MILPQPLKTLLSYVYICKNFISSYITLPYLTIHYLFLSYLTLTLYLSYPILPYLALSCLTLSYLVLPYYRALPCFIFSYLSLHDHPQSQHWHAEVTRRDLGHGIIIVLLLFHDSKRNLPQMSVLKFGDLPLLLLLCGSTSVVIQ